jgi:hypothetical protein
MPICTVSASALCANHAALHQGRRRLGRIAEEALHELSKAGATLVDPGPNGALFKDAIGEIVPAMDAPPWLRFTRSCFPPEPLSLRVSVAIAGRTKDMPRS